MELHHHRTMRTNQLRCNLCRHQSSTCTEEDGCSNVCTTACGFDCHAVEPQVCTSECGDGICASDKTCDDGNTVYDCSSNCHTTEHGWKHEVKMEGQERRCALCAAGKLETGGVCQDCLAGTDLSTEGSSFSEDSAPGGQAPTVERDKTVSLFLVLARARARSLLLFVSPFLSVSFSCFFFFSSSLSLFHARALFLSLSLSLSLQTPDARWTSRATAVVNEYTAFYNHGHARQGRRQREAGCHHQQPFWYMRSVSL